VTASIGANEVVSFSKVQIRRQVSGRVVSQDGRPIVTAIVDVAPYRAKEKFNGSFPENERLWSYVADKDGFFCLGDLPDGKYVLRFGTNAFAFKHLVIRLDKRRSASANPLQIKLDVGT